MNVLYRIVAKSKTVKNFNQIVIHKFYVCGRITGMYSPDRIKNKSRHITSGVKITVIGKQFRIREERFF